MCVLSYMFLQCLLLVFLHSELISTSSLCLHTVSTPYMPDCPGGGTPLCAAFFPDYPGEFKVRMGSFQCVLLLLLLFLIHIAKTLHKHTIQIWCHVDPHPKKCGFDCIYTVMLNEGLFFFISFYVKKRTEEKTFFVCFRHFSISRKCNFICAEGAQMVWNYAWPKLVD